MTGTTQIIEGVVAFPASIGFAGEVAGTVTVAKIGGVDYEVEMPHLEAGDREHRPKLVPPHVRSVREDIDWADYFNDPFAWGYVREWHQDGRVEDVAKVDISYILLRREFSKASSEEGCPENLESHRATLFESIDRWSSLLMDWMEVGFRKALQGVREEVQEEGKALHAWGHDGSKYVTLATKKTIIGATINIGEAGLPLDTWHRAVHRASVGDVPPTEYVLLRDARRNLQNGDFRRSVLDAATGAEMALTRMLDTHLASSSPIVSELVKDRWAQIGGLVKALKKLGVKLPNGIDGAGLATPRNHAIHRGAMPSKDEATMCVSNAEKIIELTLPLATIF